MPSKIKTPSQKVLFTGAIRTSIVHAIATAQLPDLDYLRSWKRMNYSMQDSAGTRGTISFDGDTFVGVFRYDKSTRCPWHSKTPYDIESFFRGIPESLRKLADTGALRFVLDEHEGKTFPTITCAFWGDGNSEQVEAAEPWETLLKHGGDIAAVDFMPDSKAYQVLSEEYELDESLIELAQAIHKRKLAAGTEVIDLENSEVKLLKEIADKKNALKSCRESFAEIGIRLP